jgi:hypothetical protein
MFTNLSALSPWVLILGVAIVVMSVMEALFTDKTRKERVFKGITAILAIALLIVQANANKQARAASETAVENALEQQKEQLTTAFNTGTRQVITLAGRAADQAQKAAARQAIAIRRQASEDENRLENASLGSDLCPQLRLGFTSIGPPFSLYVDNESKTADIYDLVVYVQEGEHTKSRRGFLTLQYKKLRFRTILPGATGQQPFNVLSKRKTSYLQYTLATRRKVCSGLIVLHNEGGGRWYPHSYPVHEGPLADHNTEIPTVDRPWNPSKVR